MWAIKILFLLPRRSALVRWRWRAFDLHFFFHMIFMLFFLCFAFAVDLGVMGRSSGYGGHGFIKQMCMKIYARIRAQ